MIERITAYKDHNGRLDSILIGDKNHDYYVITLPDPLTCHMGKEKTWDRIR